ncbi:MAG TPA: hypothetical protein VFC46_04015 [Humisphaera sp.]|nr:hypothetical protein [Humisphaera sp.]
MTWLKINHSAIFAMVMSIIVATAHTGSAAPSSAPTRMAIPAPAEQHAAAKRVSELFKDDISKAKKPADKVALAKKLLQAGIDEANDPVGRYAVLMLARDTATAAGDCDVAIDALDELGKSYQLDPLPLKADALASAGRSAGTSAAHKAIALRAGQMADEAVGVDQFDLAKKLADVAMASARKSDDPALIATTTNGARDAAANALAFHEAVRAASALQANPADAGANFAVGRFRCLVKGDWEGGLPFLAKGSDSTLKAVAAKELHPPTDADSQVALGDDWWNLAAKESGIVKRHMMEHAGTWYSLALPSSGGLVRVKMERRLAEISAGPQKPTAIAGSHAANGPCTIELTVDADIEIGELTVDALIWSNRKHVFTEIPKNMNNLVFNRDRARASPKKYSIKALTGGYLYFFGEKCDQSLATFKPRLEDLKGAIKGPFVTDCLRMRVKEGEEINLSGLEVHVAAASIKVVK